jgi:hypothetical protein
MRNRGRRFLDAGLSPVWVLIIINLMVFIATLVSGNIVYRLGLVPAALAQQPWTLFTALFVHASFWHIFGNMVTLYFFGTFLSRLIGNGRFLIVYFVGGLIGNLAFLALGPSYAIAVGASGAVYAVAGVLVVLVPKLRVALWGVIPMPLWVLILVFFVLWPFIFGLSLQVAWQAHLGGLVTGVIAGFIFRRQRRYYIS